MLNDKNCITLLTNETKEIDTISYITSTQSLTDTVNKQAKRIYNSHTAQNYLPIEQTTAYERSFRAITCSGTDN